MGINLWLAPQISEHCPKKMPGRWLINFNWFRRPGTASTFTPKEGTVQACNTSEEEINIRICTLKGTTVRLSTSSKRNILVSSSFEGIIYDLNSICAILIIDQKSLYSYLQYHWWPKTFTVREESTDSSNIYRRSNEGMAIWINTTAGIIVQIHSIIWLSSKFIFIYLFDIILIIIYITKLIMNTKIMLIKSWRKINSSMIGEFASWRPNWPQFIMCKYNNKSSSLYPMEIDSISTIWFGNYIGLLK